MTTQKRHKEAERISVRDANQGFSKLIARIQQGARFVITKNNRDVARIESVETEDGIEERRQAAIERLERLMSSGRRSADGWTFRGKREELHDRSV